MTSRSIWLGLVSLGILAVALLTGFSIGGFLIVLPPVVLAVGIGMTRPVWMRIALVLLALTVGLGAFALVYAAQAISLIAVILIEAVGVIVVLSVDHWTSRTRQVDSDAGR
jgi:hypothetical protein